MCKPRQVRPRHLTVLWVDLPAQIMPPEGYLVGVHAAMRAHGSALCDLHHV